MAKLILLRHGQSLWNLENRFTGWTDVDLSDQGKREAADAARLLIDEGLRFDMAFTSVLKRAIRTLWIVMDKMDLMWIPVERTWRLNERHYGALQGKNKGEMAQKFGKEQIHRWRRGYDVRPPLLDDDDPRHPRHDPCYQALPQDVLPRAESLKDTLTRVLPYWHDRIYPILQCGHTVLIAAHGNSLRALLKHIEGISDEEISGINIPTGIPRVYTLNEDMNVVSVRYLGDPEKVKKAISGVANQV